MDAEGPGAFSESAIAVFHEKTGLVLRHHASATRLSPATGRPVLVIIGVTGSLRGQVVFAMNQKFANKVALDLGLTASTAVATLAEAIASRATGRMVAEPPVLTPALVVTAQAPDLDFLGLPSGGLTLESAEGNLEIDLALSPTP